MTDRPVLVLFRDDLRLSDNPAFTAAIETGRPLAALFVLDEVSPGIRPLGGAARWWLDGSLKALSAALSRHNVNLILRRGPMRDVVLDVVRSIDAAEVVWNRRYGAAEHAIDTDLKQALTTRGVAVRTFNAALLYEPSEIRAKGGGPFKVFTPFWRAAQLRRPVRRPQPPPARLAPFRSAPPSDALAQWALLPTAPDWASGLRDAWSQGEVAALHRLDDFLKRGLAGYADRRDRPDQPSTSRLSPHLRFGELSPAQTVQAAETAFNADVTGAARRDLDKFLAEIGWREFAYHLLGQFPELATKNFQPRFDAFPWRDDPVALSAWQRGQTGYPIVDAGMRELWHTGWMHNRVRMIVASFLVKHLLIDWRRGEEWFWDTLVDADPANNPASWQWVAGSGADAAPFFRIFNPILQGEKFDPEGAYVRRWVPELAILPNSVVHRPWTAGGLTLRDAGITLGRTYPHPLVDHDHARARALAAFRCIREAV